MEIWKDIKNFERYYQISTHQRVISLKRIIQGGVNGHRTVKERFLAATLHPSGYLRVTLRKNGKSKGFMLHQLIAAAFIPNPLNLPHINHINGNKTDNRVENLEWCTPSQNILHAYETGLKSYSKLAELGRKAADTNRKPVNKLTKEGDFICRYSSLVEAENDTGVPLPNISELCNGTNPKRKTAGGFKWEFATIPEK